MRANNLSYSKLYGLLILRNYFSWIGKDVILDEQILLKTLDITENIVVLKRIT